MLSALFRQLVFDNFSPLAVKVFSMETFYFILRNEENKLKSVPEYVFIAN